MKKTIFYSWQSDLPNATNRSFIENAINYAIKDIKSDVFVELSIDKDTSGIVGTPEIVNTIFQKIKKSTIFIADVSIINMNFNGRKTPNPNVLFELGYAFNTLGHEKIICVLNTDYGKIEDLPFDLRQKRIFQYSLNQGGKKEESKKLSQAIKWSLEELFKKDLMQNELEDYFKVQVDTQLLRLLNHIAKIVFGYEKYKTLNSIKELFLLNEANIKNQIQVGEFLGFQIFKQYEKIEEELRILVDKIITSTHYKTETIVPLIKIIKWIGGFEKLHSLRTNPSLFLLIDEKCNQYKSICGQTLDLQNTKTGYLLLYKVDNLHGQVIDFGDFTEKIKIDNQLNYYRINPNCLDQYINGVLNLLSFVEEWLDMTGGEFIIDNNKEYEIKMYEEIKKNEN